MRFLRFGTLAAAAVILLAANAAPAATRYWAGSSGDWSDTSHWSTTYLGSGGASLPAEDDTVDLRLADLVNRVITYTGVPGTVPSLSRIMINGQNPGSTTLTVSAGQLQTSDLDLGTTARGYITQTGGSVWADWLTMGLSTGGNGFYTLQDGQLTTWMSDVRGGTSHALTTFTQTGGTHSTSNLTLAGTYVLSGGDLIAESSRVSGLFQHQAGTHTATFLATTATGQYQWTGGNLSITSGWLVRNAFTFPTSPRTLNINGLVDIDAHTFTNAGNVSLQLGPQSLLLVDAGYNPASEFGSFSNQGITHVNGNTLTIPAGHTIRGAGTIQDPLEVYGTITCPGVSLSLYGRINIYEGAVVENVVLLPAETSTMQGASLSGTIRMLGSLPVTFRQTAGLTDVDFLYVNGASPTGETLYDFQNGSLVVGHAFIGGSGANRLRQSGGAVTVDPAFVTLFGDVTIASSSTEAAIYEMSGGSLDVPIMKVATEYDYGTFAVTSPACSIRVSSSLSVANSAKFQAVPGTTIHLAGASWLNESTHPDLLQDLRQTSFIFENDPAAATFQVAGLNLGPHISGFTSNFAHGALQIGGDEGAGWVQLIDTFDNSTANANPEVLYVKHLILNSGSTLDLSGKTVYYYRLTDNGGTLIESGGQLIQVPVLPGDSSGDDAVNALDIAPFIQALVNPTAYALDYPHADHLAMNDLDGDGLVNALDIAAFVAALVAHPASNPVPEPASGLSLLLLLALLPRRRPRFLLHHSSL